jgi:protein pelota
MRLVNRHIDKDKSGHVTLRPEDDEDMWHLYNLIQEGDQVRAPTIRRVQNISSTGSSESQRIKLSLTLSVTKIHFSAAASAATGPEGSSSNQASATSSTTITAAIQISGRVTSENPHVKMGAFHTLDIEGHKDVRIIKEEWDSVALQRVTEACVEGRGAEVGAIVCGEGTAAVCLLSEHMTVIRQRVDVPVPRKRMGSSTLHEKGLERFYAALYASLLRHIPFSILRVIVLASPGFVKDSVYDYIFAEATRTGNKALLAARSKFVRVHVSSPHVHSLVEALKSPEITSQLKETKFAREGIVLDKFFKMLGSDEMRAWYGPDHVSLAADRGAIGTLLISDQLFRSSDVKERRRFVDLVETVRGRGGTEVVMFSSMHETGQQLNQLSGIAAILDFPLDIEAVEEEEKAAKEAEIEWNNQEEEPLAT